MTISFDPQVVANILNFEAFLEEQEEKELQVICSKANDSEYVEMARSQTLYFNRWQVAWIVVKAPFDMLLYLFFKCSETLLEFFEYYEMAHWSHLKALNQLSDIQSLNHHFQFQDHFLCPCFGTQNPQTSSLYNLSPIAKQNIEDPDLRDLAPSFGLSFYHSKGSCRGICNWFLQLYTKSLPEFNYDHRVCLRAVSEQFVEGASFAPSLLQTFLYSENGRGSLELQFGLLTLPYNDFLTQSRRVAREINNLSPGIYEIGTQTHLFIFIKIDESHGFIFDPSYLGLVQLEGAEMSQRLIDRIHHHQKRHPSASAIEFILVQPKSNEEQQFI